jgi:tetratricopeptide (TPR) repeat protein
MKPYKIILLGFLVLLIILAGCSVSPEKSAYKQGKKYMKSGDLERAYIKFQQALVICKQYKIPVSAEFANDLLDATLQKMDIEYTRILENPEEANLEKMDLMRQDFKEYIGTTSSPDINNKYVGFLLKLAASETRSIALSYKVEALEEVKKIDPKNPESEKINTKLLTQRAAELYSDAEIHYKNGLKTKTDETNANFILAEYKLLLAQKYDPKNKKVAGLLSGIYAKNITQYSGYESFTDVLGALDPDVDKYDIYLVVPSHKVTPQQVKLEIGLTNQTNGGLRVENRHFYLAMDNGDTLRASSSSRLNWGMLDSQIDTSGLGIFVQKRRGARPKSLIYNNGDKISVKNFK